MDTLNLCFSCINKWEDLRSASLDPLGHPSCRTCMHAVPSSVCAGVCARQVRKVRNVKIKKNCHSTLQTKFTRPNKHLPDKAFT